MKRCCLCRTEKPENEFPIWKGKALVSYCIPCHRRYCRERYWSIKNGTWKPKRKPSQATHCPSLRELEWAAGFLEGEGTFRKGHGNTVQVTQVNREPLDKIHSMFGGTIGHYPGKMPNASPYFSWCVTGSRARGVMMTLYSLMSDKRKGQIQAGLSRGF